MRIAMLSASVSRRGGGIFEVERRVSQELARQPDVTMGIFGIEDEFTVADRSQWEPLQPRALRSSGPASFGYSPGLLPAVQAWAPDLLHLHSLWMYPSIVMQRWRQVSRKPTLITASGMLDAWALRNSRWKKRLALALFERRNLEEASCIQALNQNEAASIRALGLTNPIAVIPNAVDLPVETSPEDAPPPLWARGRKVLLFLGRLHPKKGLVPLLKAWSRCRIGGRNQEWLLAVAGWDQEGHEQELKALADELKLPWCDAQKATERAVGEEPALIFAGPQFGAEKDRIYRAAEAFVLPSFSEGLPMTVLEAWAYGKPVVMTLMCNLPEGFAAGAALRIEPEAESITAGLTELTSFSAGERMEMGLRGRQLVETQFTWPQVAEQMREVYRWLVEGAARPDCVSPN